MVKVVDDSYEDKFYFSINKKFFLFLIILLVLLSLLLIYSFLIKLKMVNVEKSVGSCGDGSFVNSCSLNKPYYCDGSGKLVENSDFCGCPENFSKFGDGCVYEENVGQKEISLKYLLDGEEFYLSFLAYDHVDNRLDKTSQSIKYYGNEISSRADFKINKIEEPFQRYFLIPLVVEIQNLAPNNKDDQARIAISLVQNIPYSKSNKTFYFGNQELDYSRYPYQILYDYAGICGEKTELLAFLLKELGYGVSFFYYPEENHEALGIKCPVYQSTFDTGFCFVETTAPSIIGDTSINYVGIGKLNSNPELFFISEGIVFGEENFYEAKDFRKIKKIRNFIERYGWIGPINKNAFDKLRNKYGLVDEYYSD